MRPTIAILSTKNLIHNVLELKNHSRNSKFIAMVKANAYGHGIRSVASRIQNYVDIFGVASIDEALILRKIGIKNEIMLAEGVFSEEEFLIASAENFQIVIHNEEQIQWLKNIHYLPNKITLWFKIDTGMGRLGFNIDNGEKILQVKKIFDHLSQNSFLKEKIRLISHFACADEKNHPLNQTQILRFEKFFSLIEKDHGEIYKSFCNSAGIINFPDQQYDFVRSGIAMYGIDPSEKIKNLKSVMHLQAKIIAIKNISKGEFVGYGATFQANEDKKIAILSIGYGDGYSRTINGAPVMIDEKIFYSIGRVSMDMTAIDITHSENIKVGDWAILWSEKLPIDTIAKHSKNSYYDLLTSVQHRVKFQWAD
jgi:alanine racemase